MITSVAARSEDTFGQPTLPRATLRGMLANRHAVRRTCAELGALSDRQLRDLGLTRERIKDAAAAASAK